MSRSSLAALLLLVTGCASTKPAATPLRASPERRQFDIEIAETDSHGVSQVHHQRMTVGAGKRINVRSVDDDRRETIGVTYDGGDVATIEVTREKNLRPLSSPMKAKKRFACGAGERFVVASERDARTGSSVQFTASCRDDG